MASNRSPRLMSFGMMLLVLGLMSPQVRAQKVPSRPADGGERLVDYDFSRGVDLDAYTPVRGEAVCDLAKCENSAEARTRTKEAAYETAFRRIDQMGRTYTLARRYYFEGFNRLTDDGDKSILRQDIVFIKALEKYDYRHREYKYIVDLGVLKVPRLMPELEADLRRFLERIRPVEEDGVLVFDITKILGELKEDREFLDRLQRYKTDKKFQSSIRYKDDDTQSFIGAAQGMEVRIHGYDRGQYSINSLIGSIIQGSVAPWVLRSLGSYKTLTVICEGGTDALKIAGALPYNGAARLGGAGDLVSLSGPAAGQLVGTQIRSNLALSFVRGFEGAQALSEILGPVLKSGRVQVVYTGAGVVSSEPGDRPESRRIVFKIRLGQRLD